MDIKQYPYITIKENSERDEYGKYKLISIRIDDMSSKYLVINSHDNEKLSDIVENSYTPIEKDKIFFMKGCNVPRVKLKDLAVKHKIRTTTDVNLADVIVYSNKAENKLFNREWVHAIDSKVFLSAITAFNKIDCGFDSYYLTKLNDFKDSFDNSEFPEKVYTNWSTYRYLSSTDCGQNKEWLKIYYKLMKEEGISINIGSNGFATNNQYLRTPNCNQSDSSHLVFLDYNNIDVFNAIKSKKLIDQNAILTLINGDDSTTIDLDTYQNLRNMFKSSDNDNHLMAMEIMANSNYNKSRLFLEMLFFHHQSEIESCKSKNHVNFKSLKNYLNKDNWWNRHVDTIIANLGEDGQLTKEALNFILEDQKDYFKNNGHSNYIKVQNLTLSQNFAEQNNLNWSYSLQEDYVKKDLEVVSPGKVEVDEKVIASTEDLILKKEVVEDTVDEVEISEAYTEEAGTLLDDKQEEIIEAEELLTETILEEKSLELEKTTDDEQDFDWF